MISITEEERKIVLDALVLYMAQKAKSMDEANELHDLYERFRLAEVKG